MKTKDEWPRNLYAETGSRKRNNTSEDCEHNFIHIPVATDVAEIFYEKPSYTCALCILSDLELVAKTVIGMRHMDVANKSREHTKPTSIRGSLLPRG